MQESSENSATAALPLLEEKTQCAGGSSRSSSTTTSTTTTTITSSTTTTSTSNSSPVSPPAGASTSTRNTSRRRRTITTSTTTSSRGTTSSARRGPDFYVDDAAGEKQRSITSLSAPPPLPAPPTSSFSKCTSSITTTNPSTNSTSSNSRSITSSSTTGSSSSSGDRQKIDGFLFGKRRYTDLEHCQDIVGGAGAVRNRVSRSGFIPATSTTTSMSLLHGDGITASSSISATTSTSIPCTQGVSQAMMQDHVEDEAQSLSVTKSSRTGQKMLQEHRKPAEEGASRYYVARETAASSTRNAAAAGGKQSQSVPGRKKKPFKCDRDGCDYASYESSKLRRHIMTHTGERPYACTYPRCTYASARSSDLVCHLRIHTGEKPFKCTHPGCGYMTARSGNLSTHMRVHRADRNVAYENHALQIGANLFRQMDSHKDSHSKYYTHPAQAGSTWTNFDRNKTEGTFTAPQNSSGLDEAGFRNDRLRINLCGPPVMPVRTLSAAAGGSSFETLSRQASTYRVAEGASAGGITGQEAGWSDSQPGRQLPPLSYYLSQFARRDDWKQERR
jgi:hypothetical protein